MDDGARGAKDGGVFNVAQQAAGVIVFAGEDAGALQQAFALLAQAVVLLLQRGHLAGQLAPVRLGGVQGAGAFVHLALPFGVVCLVRGALAFSLLAGIGNFALGRASQRQPVGGHGPARHHFQRAAGSQRQRIWRDGQLHPRVVIQQQRHQRALRRGGRLQDHAAVLGLQQGPDLAAVPLPERLA